MRTALARYALLEARGTWFDGRSARPTEVVVKFGEATLTLFRPDGMPLAHWALASLRALRDTAGRGQLVLTPDEASEERLTLTDPDMIGAIRAVCPDLDRRRAPRGQLRSALAWAGGAVAAVLLIVFVIVPAIAGELARLIPPAREQAMGAAVMDQISAALGGFRGRVRSCDSRAGLAALERMVGRLAPHVRAHVPLKVRVLDHPMVNAFAVPGGHVALFRGLIEDAESPEEVAAVLAHEAGHVVHRDPTRLALRAAGSAGILGLLLGDVTGGTIIVLVADQLVTAAYTREAEASADAEAHRILAAAGLPATPMAGFFLRLARRHGGDAGLLTHLATHPDLGARARAAEAADTIRGGRYQPVLTDQDWVALRNICDR